MRTGLCGVGIATVLCVTCPAEDNLSYAQRLVNDGLAKFDNGQFRDSEDFFRRGLAIRERLLPADAWQIGAALNELGASLFSQARFQEAEPLYLRAIAIFRSHPDRPRDLAGALANVASLYREQRRFAEASATYDELFKITPNPRATVYNDYGMLLRAKGEWNRAEAAFRRAAEIVARAHDPDVSVSWTSLGDLYYTRGDYAQAEAFFRKAADACRSTGKDDRRCGPALNGLGLSLMRDGLQDEARAALERARRIFERTYGGNDPKLAAVLNNLGSIAQNKHDSKLAEAYFSRALAIWTVAYGPDHPAVASVTSNLGTLHMQRREWKKAESSFTRALAIDQGTAGKDRERIARDFNNLGVLYFTMKRNADAVDCFKHAVEAYEKTAGPSSRAVAGALLNLANCFAKTKQYADAARIYKRALDIYDRHPTDDTAMAAAFDYCAQMARQCDDYADAERAETLAMRLRVRTTLARDRLE